MKRLIDKLNKFDVLWYLCDDTQKYNRLQAEYNELVNEISDLDSCQYLYLMTKLHKDTFDYFIDKKQVNSVC